MIKHFVKHGLRWTFGDLPMEENGIKSIASDVTQEQINMINEGTHDFDIVNGKVVFVESDRKDQMDEIKAQQEAEAQENEELKAKLAGGKATPEEVQVALSKII